MLHFNVIFFFFFFCMFRFLFIHCYFFCKVDIVVKVFLHVQILHMFVSLGYLSRCFLLAKNFVHVSIFFCKFDIYFKELL
jgi:hypothetical protein